MNEREELAALRRLAELEAKSGGGRAARVKAQEEADRKEFSPTKGQSFGQNIVQGVGAGMSSAVRALGGGSLLERFGLPGTKEEADRLDAPLDETAGGTIGRAVGIAAPAAVAIPFTPATLPAGIAAGAGTGALLTEGGVGDRLQGAALGGAGAAVAGALPVAYRMGRGLARGVVEPMTEAGRDRIAGRAIQRFAADPSALRRASSAPSVTGAVPTLAEATGDAGIATLQRAISTIDPETAAMLQARQQANNAARLETLRSVAGQGSRPASRVGRLNQLANGQPTEAAATAARSGAARQSYGEAFDAGIDPAAAEALAPQIESLMARPSVRAGLARARQLAAEEGIELADPGSVQGIHYLKQALDDQVGRLRDQPTRQRLVQQTSADLASVLEEIAPLYQTARREFQMNSVPVTRAQVGERLLNTTQGAIRDFGGDRRLQANAFAKALNDEANLLQQATGFRGAPQSLDDVMTPTQMGRLNAIRDELEMVANLGQAANGPGSQTAKMLASQNLLRQIAGPAGLPESFFDSVLSQTLMRPVQFGLQAAEPRIGAAIGRGLMDPGEAQRLISAASLADTPQAPNRLAALLRRAAPAAIGASAAYGAGQ